jgi:hypothetical protein
MREGEFLYVDKSDMIPQILSDKTEVYQFTRPRRFGKSLNLSMLDAFFNIRYSKDNRWFDGLKVSDCEECQIHKNAYPVIYFDFKELGVSNMETFNSDLVDEMSNLYSNYEYLADSDRLNEADRRYFNEVLLREMNPISLRKSISNLSRILLKHHGRKVIIFLDEYDNPINHAYGKPFQKDIINIMRDILSSALKGNDSLQFGVVTGVMQISKESIFSGLNNLKVDNIFSKRFDEMFGFTDAEVKSICENCGHPEKYEEAKEWYDGYRFGNADVYNPWSIIRYVDEDFEPQTYWAGTSGNDIIRTLLRNSNDNVLDDLRILAEGGSITKSLDPTVAFDNLEVNRDNIYSVMAMSGYLRAQPIGKNFSISIPNGEMYEVFSKELANHLSAVYGEPDILKLIQSLSDSLIANDVPALESTLYEIFAGTFGSFMLSSEKIYQAIITTLLLSLARKYTIKAEFENGKGRYDILMESRVPGCPHVVIELKRSNTDDNDNKVLEDATKALTQIKEKDYGFGLKGEIILYGIAFRGKEPKILSEKMTH